MAKLVFSGSACLVKSLAGFHTPGAAPASVAQRPAPQRGLTEGKILQLLTDLLSGEQVPVRESFEVLAAILHQWGRSVSRIAVIAGIEKIQNLTADER